MFPHFELSHALPIFLYATILFASLHLPLAEANERPIPAHKNSDSAPQATPQFAKQLWQTFFFADARFRQESIFQTDTPNRYRYRLRFRMGGTFPVHSTVNLGFRMVTGATDDPTTSNVDMDDYFSKKGFNLDQLFLKYSPHPWVSVFVGKFANPFEHLELVFHNDVQLEGAAEQFRFNDVGFINQVQVNLGQFMVDEVRNDPDTTLFAGQLFLKGFGAEGLGFGATLYEYRNADNIAQAVEDGRLVGGDTNARVGKGTGTSAYLFGFRIFEGLVRYEFAVNSVPFWGLGAYAQNLLADFNARAYWLEIGVGPISSLRGLKGLYHFVRVERESMISNFNNADIFNPNTRGHELKVAMPVVENISIEGLYFLAKRIISSGTNPYQHKTRLQVKVKF